MPKIRYYKVNQERVVRVSATNQDDALALANRVLSGTKHPEDQLNVQEYPLEVSLTIREEIHG